MQRTGRVRRHELEVDPASGEGVAPAERVALRRRPRRARRGASSAVRKKLRNPGLAISTRSKCGGGAASMLAASSSAISSGRAARARWRAGGRPGDAQSPAASSDRLVESAMPPAGSGKPAAVSAARRQVSMWSRITKGVGAGGGSLHLDVASYFRPSARGRAVSAARAAQANQSTVRRSPSSKSTSARELEVAASRWRIGLGRLVTSPDGRP